MFEQLPIGVQTFLTSLFSVSTTLAVVYWFARKGAENFFSKRLEKFRAQLNGESEAQRYSFQRDLSNYALFAPAKHEAYRKIFRSYLVAEGLFAALSGLSRELDWQQVTKEDARAVLVEHDLSESFIERVLTEWDSNRSNAIVELRKAIRHAKVEKAQNAYVEFNNTRLEWALYCSESASKAIGEASDALAKLSAHYFVEPDIHTGVAALKREVNAQAVRLLAALRSEISIGAKEPS